eukprot:CAMPEP_0196824536 /NCGR_PEP_ID=MMETSP1362-20130617/92259_1 /TAXON_ID=163516 /ORGANISM="Leptocylindrus danicus, Strain CCMP1856" /LENGTH=635 /DNA_ID=CAMNT_0042204829 /DNA_START=54 /DNA_END=1961 /DNA_ORIENTATION=+
MTRMLSLLVYQFGTLKLVYRSFKALQGFEQNQNSGKNGTLVRKNQINIQTSLSQNEWEVLTLWALHGVHYGYLAFHVETVVECLIPFYYYLKIAFVLFVWVIPSRNKVPSYLLYKFVVPAIDYAHVFLCDTMEQICYHVVVRRVPLLLPLFLLDLVFPGIISQTCSEDDNQFIVEHSNADVDVNLKDGDDLSGVPYAVKLKRLRWQQILQAQNSSDECIDVPQLSNLDSMSTISSGTNDETVARCRSLDGFESSLDNIVEHSGVQNSKQFSSPAKKRSPWTFRRKSNESEDQYLKLGKDCHTAAHFDTRRELSITSLDESGCESRSFASKIDYMDYKDDDNDVSLAALLDQNSIMDDNENDNDDGDTNLLKVRESSWLLRRFSEDHPVTPRKDGKDFLPAVKTPSVTQAHIHSRAKFGYSDEENESHTDGHRRKVEGPSSASSQNKMNAKKRQSLGEQFRTLVTGDSNTRLRDYLFDLDLPQTTLCGSAIYEDKEPPPDIMPINYPRTVDHIRKYRNRLDLHQKKDERRRRSLELLSRPLDHDFSTDGGKVHSEFAIGNITESHAAKEGTCLGSHQSKEKSFRGHTTNTKTEQRLPSPRKVRNGLRRSKRLATMGKASKSKPNSKNLSDLIQKCE